MKFDHYSKTLYNSYPICILVNRIRKDEIKKRYLDPFNIDPDNVLLIELHREPGKKKVPVSIMKAFMDEEVKKVLEDFQADYLFVADADYYKVITGSKSAELKLGYVEDNKYGNQKAIYFPNYQAVFYDPVKIMNKIEQAADAFISHTKGTYAEPGSDLVKHMQSAYTAAEVKYLLDLLLVRNEPLAADIEGWSLSPCLAGIATIAFSWDTEGGYSLCIDESDNPALARMYLREFFERFEQKITYHNIAFDATVLIYQLYMKHITDTEGLLKGLKILLKNWDCTKIITYLATNSCAGNKLGLKDQAQEFAGNYALEDIKDITKVPLTKLLTYNLVDSMSTNYVKKKHWDTMVKDDQLNVYNTIFKPAMVDVIQMQLTGLPVDMDRVYEVDAILQKDSDDALNGMLNNPIMQQYSYLLNERWVENKNATLKKKRVTLADANEVFNPNSDQQLADFLFKHLDLPVLSLTDSKAPSTDGDTIKALVNHTEDPLIKDFLKHLVAFKAVGIILTTFIPAFKNARQGPDGWHYLLGNFNLGGTKSGRLSSSGPNLQNLPAGGKYGELIKTCFKAPPGWLFCGIDFSSLEDRISALTTRDPQKLKVYTDGYDGHCLRAFAYFGDQMPDIDPLSVDSINSIAKKYKPQRQDSKVPTFLLTYGGTYMGIMEQCGFPKDKAQAIEANYHKLYVVSDKWVADRVAEACKVGYVTAAFGLRLRTPLLAQVVLNSGKTPFEAEAEGRTAGNALGQSWCLLNTRAGIEFNGKVRASKHAHDIRPCAQIHDAQYFLVRDNVEAIKYANDNVVEATYWQDDPLIYHDTVKLGGDFGIFYPDWSKECTLPNYGSEDEIREAVLEHWDDLHKKAA